VEFATLAVPTAPAAPAAPVPAVPVALDGVLAADPVADDAGAPDGDADLSLSTTSPAAPLLVDPSVAFTSTNVPAAPAFELPAAELGGVEVLPDVPTAVPL